MSRSTERTTPHSVPGNPTCSQKEDATLPRVFGFVACISLLIAVLWWVNLGETAEPVRTQSAENDADANAAPKTAKQLYSKGRELYWQEQYAEAASALEAARSIAAELPDADRSRLEHYLKLAR